MNKNYPKLVPDDLHSTSVYHEYYCMIPSSITIAKTKEYKDGSFGYLVFGSFLRSTSREQPSLGKIRAFSDEEALEKAQEIIHENYDIMSEIISETAHCNTAE